MREEEEPRAQAATAWLRYGLAALLVACGAALAARHASIQAPPPPPVRVLADTRGERSGGRAVAEIAAVVAAWNEHKQEAMGPHHDASALAASLHGPLLAEWQDKVSHYRAQGWCYTYDLQGMEVLRWEQRGADAMCATVRVSETAHLTAATGAVERSYTGAYEAEYEMQRTVLGWRIVRIDVR